MTKAFASNRASLKEQARRNRKRKVHENEGLPIFVQSVEQLHNRGPIFRKGTYYETFGGHKSIGRVTGGNTTYQPLGSGFHSYRMAQKVGEDKKIELGKIRTNKARKPPFQPIPTPNHEVPVIPFPPALCNRLS